MISPRFADIFRGNSLKGGLLTVELSQDVVDQLWAACEKDPQTTVTVDLHTRTVSCGDLVVPFEIDDYTRWRLLEGLDDIGLTLRHEGDIATFESNRPAHLPKTLPIPASSTV